MIDLVLKAEVENVKKIGVKSDHLYFLKLKCTNCHDDFPSAVGVSRDMVVEGIKGASVNLKIKCKGCDRVHDIMFADEGHDEEGHGWHADGGEFQRFASFECRGLDPIGYEIRDGYYVVANDGTRFDDVDLSEDFCECDDKGNVVTVEKVEAKLTAATGGKGKKKKK
mmetsp:Transcript_37699/g.96347  ORF Transcript_37699/g.96347 Transcript_37699/m.96347 type:complete len:167 (-) Transcript_37699:30-530(-)